MAVLTPLRRFLDTEASGGVLLLAATLVALIWANSPLAESYDAVWQTPVGVAVGDGGLTKPLQLWINDGLMAVFFFVVGLEIKRELLIGELSSPRQAVLPIAAAIAGALLPALMFLGFTLGTPSSAGWGVPMATDVAFALGVLAVLGSRVPIGLKVFVTALAIVDDVVAILVIGIVYSTGLSVPALVAAGAIVLVLIGAARIHVRRNIVYGILGVALWLAVLSSGIHATIGGVILALVIPATTRTDVPVFVGRARQLIDQFAEADSMDADPRTNSDRQAVMAELEDATDAIQAPLQRLERTLHPWVAYGIVPLFALANAGVSLGPNINEAVGSPLAFGIVVGLVFGKQLGVVAATWAIVKVGLGALPHGVTWRHIWGAGWVAGIGFTVSLFVADLAFVDRAALDVAKVAVLGASLIAGVGGWLVLRSAAPRAD